MDFDEFPHKKLVLSKLFMGVEWCILAKNLCMICIYTSMQYHAYITTKIIFHTAIFYIVKNENFWGFYFI